MTKKYIITIVLIIIAVAGLIFIQNKDMTPTTDAVPESNVDEILAEPYESTPIAIDAEIVEITYTDSGFSPSETIVEAGTNVLFVNKSTKKMWVASNPHPTHSIYPRFDQLQIGDEYLSMFTDPGTYNYHNHVSPRDGGKIIVK